MKNIDELVMGMAIGLIVGIVIGIGVVKLATPDPFSIPSPTPTPFEIDQWFKKTCYERVRSNYTVWVEDESIRGYIQTCEGFGAIPKQHSNGVGGSIFSCDCPIN